MEEKVHAYFGIYQDKMRKNLKKKKNIHQNS